MIRTLTIFCSIIVLTACITGMGRAAEPVLESPVDAGSEITEADGDTFQKWAFFPVIASSTETGFQLGALAVRFFKPDTDDSRTSTIDFIGFGTVEGQYFAGITPNFYFSQDRYHVYAGLSGRFWPANFYGIGNDTREDAKETYESTQAKIRVGAEIKWFDLFYAGPVYQYANERMDTEAGGIIERYSLPGVDGGVRSGVGATISLDRRDNLNDAREGTYAMIDCLFYEESLGSDYRYSAYGLDLRQYTPFIAATALAFRGYARMTRGDVPFQELSSPDGFKMLRGIEKGRYRERDMISLQTEWRFPIYQRFGGVVFVETAQVAREISAIRNDAWKFAAGTGLRYALNPAERFNIRLDLSWVDSGFGVALGIREAF